MSAPEFQFPALDMKAGKLNSPKPEQLAPPASIRDIERDARVIQLNSKLQLYRVGLASAGMGVLVALGVIGTWRLLVPSPVSNPVANVRPLVEQRPVQPVSPAERIAPPPAASLPATVNLPALAPSSATSVPTGSVFASPIRIAAPGSAPLRSSEVSSSFANSEKPGLANVVRPVQLPPPVKRSPVGPIPKQQEAGPHHEKRQQPAHGEVPSKKVIEHKHVDTMLEHVEPHGTTKRVSEKGDARKPVEHSPHDTLGKPVQTRDTHAATQASPQAAILYVAPDRAPAPSVSKRPIASAAPPAAASRPAATPPAHVPAIAPMDIAGVPTEGVILVESSTPDGRLVRPYRVGQTLPSGEVLVSADPSDGRIVTNRRTINLKH